MCVCVGGGWGFIRKVKTFVNLLKEIYIVDCMRKEGIFYLTTHSTHFIYGNMASDIW